MSDIMNDAIIYGHMSYCMSFHLTEGNYACKNAQRYEYPRSNTSRVDEWLKVQGSNATYIHGVRFHNGQVPTMPLFGRPRFKINPELIGEIYEK